MREVHIVTGIDCSSRFLHHTIDIRYLVNRRIVAHHHAVEAYIVTKDILQDLAVGHTSDAMHIMIAWHDSHTTRQTDHCLVRQENLFHHFLLVSITAATIA